MQDEQTYSDYSHGQDWPSAHPHSEPVHWLVATLQIMNYRAVAIKIADSTLTLTSHIPFLYILAKTWTERHKHTPKKQPITMVAKKRDEFIFIDSFDIHCSCATNLRVGHLMHIFVSLTHSSAIMPSTITWINAASTLRTMLAFAISLQPVSSV